MWKEDILATQLSTLVCEKGLEHIDWVNFDQINNVVMEKWHSLWDNVVLEGDSINGSSGFNEWDQG